MPGSQTDQAQASAALAPAAGRPFPVTWFGVGLAAMALLIASATFLTLMAQIKLQHARFGREDVLHDEIDRYLTAGMWIRIAALCLVVVGAVAVRREARKLYAARAAAEACAAELREQKKELGELNRRLFDEARIDPLTRLQTRLRLNEDLDDLWASADPGGDHYCAVMCDVDRFKAYNDGYGHVAGDNVLRKVAKALLQGCRAGDRLYRYGGEEFLLLIRVASAVEALALADRHRAAVEALAIEHVANDPGVVTISMGVAPLWAGTYPSASEWIEQADAALYRAKRTGRNCIAATGHEGLMRAVA
jgi:diguanylate cyclase (GGDEF)-like protein